MADSSAAKQAEAFPDGTTEFTPLRTPRYEQLMKKPHITETSMTAKNWYKHVNWLNVTLIIVVPIYGM